jgi:hypothetical protein
MAHASIHGDGLTDGNETCPDSGASLFVCMLISQRLLCPYPLHRFCEVATGVYYIAMGDCFLQSLWLGGWWDAWPTPTAVFKDMVFCCSIFS